MKPNQKRIDNGQWWDRAWSLVEGCTPISPACRLCWSASATAMRSQQKNEKIIARYSDLIIPNSRPAKFNGITRLMVEDLNKPTTPNQKPIVWSVWNDLFHKDVPFEFQYRAFERMLHCPQHFFIVCTKRSDKMKKAMPTIWFHLKRNYSLFHPEFVKLESLKNVMGMVTVESSLFEHRIKDLLETPFAYRGLSVEPILGPLCIKDHYLAGKCMDHCETIMQMSCKDDSTCVTKKKGIDFIACGPETGAGAAPCPDELIDELYEQTRGSGTAFFDKRKKYTVREFLHETQTIF